MKIICVSDTHGSHWEITTPECDLLIHAGDCTSDGSYWSLLDFAKWLEKQPAKHKVLVAGNHDRIFERNNYEAVGCLKSACPNAIYLEDNVAEVDGLKIFGSPYTPRFMNWAFNEDRGAAIKKHWDKIPEWVDIIVTHGPPLGYCDKIYGEHLGCEDLLKAIKRTGPRLHVCGHLHSGYGVDFIAHPGGNQTQIVNAAVLDEFYICNKKPIEVTL